MPRYNRTINAMLHRLDWLTTWLEMRSFNIKNERMDFLYIVYSSAKACLLDDAAKEKTKEINSKLILPFSEEKLQTHIFDKIDKRKHVPKFKNDGIKEILKITDEEYQILDPDKIAREKEERKSRTIDRWIRNEEIISLFHTGLSVREIAQRTGVSKWTVQRQIQKWQLDQAADSSTGAEITKLSNAESISVVTNDNGRHSAEVLFGLYKIGMEEAGASVGNEQLTTLQTLTNNNENILLLGSAGCGKSYVINEYLNRLSKSEREKVLVIAPTWKAASNLNGITVHRAFALSCSVQNDTSVEFIPKPIKDIDTIIIDEISMLRVDVFNRMVEIIQYAEEKLNKHIRVIAIGDFGQLAPVCLSEDRKQIESRFPGVYCFNSPLWESLNFKKVILYQVHRQTDEELTLHLAKLKYGCEGITKWFNNNCSRFYSDNAITICPTNELVKQYTEVFIKKHEKYEFEVYEAEYDGYLTDELPVERSIALGYCRVLFMWNGKLYKRGDFGEIIHKTSDGFIVRLEKTGAEVLVQKVTWTLTNGTKYTQYPMCLACAITVNKAQGCTFEQINIDRGNGFWMPGQLYVALSRCRTKEGIHLLKPLKEKDVHVDVDALKMMQQDNVNDTSDDLWDIEF